MTEQNIDIGNTVLCDSCNEDFSASQATGGFLFQSKAICPSCAPEWERDAAAYGEAHLIRSRCPQGMPFAEWVRETLRGGKPGIIRIITGDK